MTETFVAFSGGPITFKEVSSKIKKSHNRSSSSPLDGVTVAMSSLNGVLLLDLFNCCLSTGTVSLLWKRAVIKLILKPSASTNPSYLSNFRPIALTPAVDKLYTNILRDRWIKFMIENHYWGFDTQKLFLAEFLVVLNTNLCFSKH